METIRHPYSENNIPSRMKKSLSHRFTPVL